MANLASQIGMTSTGLKPSIENGSFPINKITELCKILEITPNDFFEWNDPAGNVGVYASNISGINTQNSNEAILALKNELKQQHAIVKEKDKQINRLISIIEKWDPQA